MGSSPSRGAARAEAIFGRSENAEYNFIRDEAFESEKSSRRQEASEDQSITPKKKRLRKASGFLAALCVFGVLYRSSVALCIQVPLPHAILPTVESLGNYARQAARPLLVDFQVYPPVLIPTPAGDVLTNGSTGSVPTVVPVQTFGCVIYETLMVYEFAKSYGAPFVGKQFPHIDRGDGVLTDKVIRLVCTANKLCIQPSYLEPDGDFGRPSIRSSWDCVSRGHRSLEDLDRRANADGNHVCAAAFRSHA